MSSLPMIPAPPRAERVAALYVGSQAPARGAPSSHPHHGCDRIADRRVRRTRWARRLVAALFLFELGQEVAGLGAGRVVAGGLLVAAAGARDVALPLEDAPVLDVGGVELVLHHRLAGVAGVKVLEQP